jgi:hypothetical protein
MTGGDVPLADLQRLVKDLKPDLLVRPREHTEPDATLKADAW